jgi:hypothetical protein
MKKALILICVLAMVAFAVPAFAGFTNGNFETGDFTGWTLGGANSADSAVVSLGLDANTNNTLQRVANGSYAARVGNQSGSFHVSSVSQTVANWQDVAIQFAWAAVLQEPTNNVTHSASEMADFSVRLLNLTDTTTLYDQTYNVTSLPGSFLAGATNSVAGSAGQWQFSQYFAVSLDTSAHIGDTLQLIITATDCSLGGHGGYVYLDEVGSTPPVITTPEPMTMLLLGLGLVGLAGFRKRS